MKINYLQISNILSFRHVANISDAEQITFDPALNIIIGENGSGKSTALEVLNFIFKRILFKPYTVNRDLFLRREQLPEDQRRGIITTSEQNNYGGFRLDKNWDSESGEQRVRLAVRLDEIDRENITNLRAHSEKLRAVLSSYSVQPFKGDGIVTDEYIFDVLLNRANSSFVVRPLDTTESFTRTYLSEYNLFKEAIALHNWINLNDLILQLWESFTLIGSYRNYNSFQQTASLHQSSASVQIQDIRMQEYNRSLNATEESEPRAFALVRLRLALAALHRNIPQRSARLRRMRCPL